MAQSYTNERKYRSQWKFENEQRRNIGVSCHRSTHFRAIYVGSSVMFGTVISDHALRDTF